MKIYIPPHLKEFVIFRQLEQMILEYSKYYQPNITSFDDYEYDLANDPVKRFVNLCLSDTVLGEGQQLSEVINYISNLFYSVKGTSKVIDYIITYLPLDVATINFSTDLTTINLKDIITSDEGLFYESFREFLETLLYFRESSIEVEEINLIIEGILTTKIGIVSRSYKEFNI